MNISASRNPIISDRIGFNRRFYANNLETVFTPTNDSELVDAVKQATALENDEDDPGVRIVSGRHCYENFVFNPNSRKLIDCVGLNKVGYDSDRGYFVEAGASNWSSFIQLHSLYGKTLPSGSCYSVGLGGHIAGGGYGLLSRLQGLTVDWVTGVDIVVTPSPGNADLLHVNKSSDSELFWALRGAGGGNFGAISRFYFNELPTAPEKAEILSISTPWADIPDAETLGLLGEIFYDFVYLDNPELDPFNLGLFGITKFNHQLQSGSNVGGSIDFLLQSVNPDLEIMDVYSSLFKELKSLGIRIYKRPVSMYGQSNSQGENNLMIPSSTLQSFAFYDAVQTLNGSGTNQYGKYKSAYHKNYFSPDQYEPLFAGLTEYPKYNGDPVDMSNAWVQADSYGGIINTIDPTTTPIWQRQSTMKLQYQCHWDSSSSPIDTPNTQLDEVYINWLNSMYHNIYRDTGGWPDPYYSGDPESSPYQGCYYNYCDNELGTNEEGTESIDFAMQMYFGKVNYERLLAVKKKYDPHNILNSSQSIPLRT